MEAYNFTSFTACSNVMSSASTKRHTKYNSFVVSYISCKLLIFDIFGSSLSSESGEDGWACDVVDVDVFVDVKIIVGVASFSSSCGISSMEL
jgi:hypothetical protein